MNNEEKKRLMKELREMNVIDNFLFTEIMSDMEMGREACRLILSRVLKRKVDKIEFTPERVIPGVSEKTRGIRLDAYIVERGEDPDSESGNIRVYDVEPDKRSNKKNELPKRSRYYADLIDVQLLKTGTDYDRLPELVTIFILSYDPFGANAMVYEAGSIIKTHPEIPYNDGVRRIFLYVEGELPEDSKDDDKALKALLKYIGRSIEENVADEAIRRLDDIVKRVKAKKDVGNKYMKSCEWEKEIRKEGREEGIKEGIKEERKNTEAERKRADAEHERADRAEAELAKYKAKFGEIA